MAIDHALEPPTADQRLIWDIYFSADVPGPDNEINLVTLSRYA